MQKPLRAVRVRPKLPSARQPKLKLQPKPRKKLSGSKVLRASRPLMRGMRRLLRRHGKRRSLIV